jgi:hypothetical protein
MFKDMQYSLEYGRALGRVGLGRQESPGRREEGEKFDAVRFLTVE